MPDDVDPSDLEHAKLREVTAMLLDTIAQELRDYPEKIFRWKLDSPYPGSNLTFYTLEFSLSGDAQERIDQAAVERNLWGMGPAGKETPDA